MTLSSALNFSEPQFPPLKVGKVSTINFPKVDVKVREAKCEMYTLVFGVLNT